MSIIHDALKKVQKSMESGKNPEDIVEVIPSTSSNTTQDPKGSGLRSFLIVIASLIIFGLAIYLGFGQIQRHAPQLLTNTPFANPTKFRETLEKISEKTPFANMIKSANTPKTPEPVPLAQIRISAPTAVATSTNTSNETPAQTPTTPAPAVETVEAPTTPTAEVPPLPDDNIVTAEKAPAPIELNIQGIMSNGTNNVALINGNVYEEGSIIEGVKIVKITMQALTIEHNGQEEVVPVKK